MRDFSVKKGEPVYPGWLGWGQSLKANGLSPLSSQSSGKTSTIPGQAAEAFSLN
jgi:hypothetical protein